MNITNDQIQTLQRLIGAQKDAILMGSDDLSITDDMQELVNNIRTTSPLRLEQAPIGHSRPAPKPEPKKKKGR